MNYEVVKVEYDETENNDDGVFTPLQVKITFRRASVSGDNEKNTYNREHVNYVPLRESNNYWVGKVLELKEKLAKVEALMQLSNEVKLVVDALLWLVDTNGYGRTSKDFEGNKRAYLTWTFERMNLTDDEIRETVSAIINLEKQTRDERIRA